ncbi:Cysteine rich repeat protein [compost metagenome]
MKEAFKDVKEACHDDVEKYCANVKSGRGRIMKCMKEHKEQLSPACKAEVEEMKKNRRGK